MRTPSLAGTCVLALSLSPAAALTPQEAWQSWQDAAAQAGVVLTTGAETMEGDTLTLDGVAFAVEGADGPTVTGVMDTVAFTGRDDGSVAVDLPESIPVTMSGTNAEGTPALAEMTVSQPGLSLLMSDTEGGGVATDYAAPEITVSLGKVVEDGVELDVEGALVMTGVEGRNARSAGDLPELESMFAMDGLSATLAGTDAETGGTYEIDMAAADVRSQSRSTLTAPFTSSADLGALLDEGFSVAGEGSSGPVTFLIAAEGMPRSFRAEGGVGATSGAVRLDDERIEYDLSYEDMEFAVSSAQVPLPIEGALGRLRLLLEGPTQPTEEAQPMAFTLALRDFAVGEPIWMMVDPAGALPHDPATLVLALTGRMRVLSGTPAEETMQAGPADARIEDVTVQELRLALAGAELTGTGDFTLDYDAPGPFGPDSPAPEGRLDLRLDGGQGLLDGLVRIGLLSERQAMALLDRIARYVRPAPEGDDALVSEITVEPGGQVRANGEPLPF